MNRIKFFFEIFVVISMVVLLASCSGHGKLTEKGFVGKWQSSKSNTPINIYDNGEWELVSDDGDVKQYGVWHFFDDKLMWSVIIDDRMRHDTNVVLSSSPREFKIRETDKSVTIFKKLD